MEKGLSSLMHTTFRVISIKLHRLARTSPSFPYVGSRYYGHVTCKAKIAMRYLSEFFLSRDLYPLRRDRLVLQQAYQRPERQWPVKFRSEERIHSMGKRTRGTSLLPWIPRGVREKKKGRERQKQREIEKKEMKGEKEEDVWGFNWQKKRKKESTTVTRRDDDAGGRGEGECEEGKEVIPSTAVHSKRQWSFFSKRPELRSTYFLPRSTPLPLSRPMKSTVSTYVCPPFPPSNPLSTDRKGRERGEQRKSEYVPFSSGMGVKPTNGILFKVCPILSWMLYRIDIAWGWITRMRDACRR